MDTSKHFFQLHGVNAAEKVVLRKKLRRKEMVAFTPNHARGPAFILEHGDLDGIDLAHSVWLSAAPDRRVDRFDHSSAGDRACSSRSFHARPARSNSDLAKVDAPSCWTRLSGFSCKGRFRYANLNLPSNMIANCAFAMAHSRGGILHSFWARFNTRKRSFSALSSVGKWPRARTALRNLAFNDSIAFVV